MKTLLCLLVCMTFTGNALHSEEVKSGPKVVILLGPPGSGKGTQAATLSKELRIPHISTGDLFRENMSKNTVLGQKAKAFIHEGKLVPDEIVLDMLFERVSKADAANGYLLDGFPRTISQAEALEKHLATNTSVTVLDLEVPDDVLIKRTLGRLTCKECGELYNLHLSPSEKEGVCDKCEGELIKRADDTLEVVQERLKVYHSQTKPLEDFYEKKGVLHRIDGTKAPHKVYEALLEQLKVQKPR